MIAPAVPDAAQYLRAQHAEWNGMRLRGLPPGTDRGGGRGIEPGKEGGCTGAETQQHSSNLCAVPALLIPVHCLPLGELDRDGGLKKRASWNARPGLL